MVRKVQKKPKLGSRENPEYKRRKKAYLADRELWGGWWRCDDCTVWTQAPEIDHIQRTGMGGSPSRLIDETNWQILCRECHDKKDGGFKT